MGAAQLDYEAELAGAGGVALHLLVDAEDHALAVEGSGVPTHGFRVAPDGEQRVGVIEGDGAQQQAWVWRVTMVRPWSRWFPSDLQG